MSDTQKPAKKEAREGTISLEETRLAIGSAVSLQVQNGVAVERYTVKLIGMSTGRSVLVTAPMVDRKYLLMRDAQSFIVRAFSGKSAYAFSTQLLKSVNTPYPYLHLAYPREVKSLIVRKGARVDVRVICLIVDGENPQLQMAGLIVNLSAGGAQILVRQPPAQRDQRLVLSFRVVLNDFEALLKLGAVIRAINLDQSGESDMPYQIGTQFVDLSASDSLHLQAFLYQELLEKSLGV